MPALYVHMQTNSHTLLKFEFENVKDSERWSIRRK